jgi:hypothetical protein
MTADEAPPLAARANRAFLGRAVRYLVAEAGIVGRLMDAVPPGSHLWGAVGRKR